MKTRKAAFFDVDGTLWDENNVIPESTRKAIRKIRENGNLTFINSGRSFAYMQNPKLLGIGFDGIVGACGTMIQYNGEILFCREIDVKQMEYTINTVRRYGFRPILEGKNYLYMDEEEFADDYFGKKLKAEMSDNLLSIAKEWGKWEASKLSCAMVIEGQEECLSLLSDYYDYMIHNPYVVEMVPKGYHKGTGLLKVCELLDIAVEDAYAFGDSVNDIGMLKAAGTAVVMGNGSEVAKEAADYVTAPMMEDGIYKACEHFGLF